MYLARTNAHKNVHTHSHRFDISFVVLGLCCFPLEIRDGLVVELEAGRIKVEAAWRLRHSHVELPTQYHLGLSPAQSFARCIGEQRQ